MSGAGSSSNGRAISGIGLRGQRSAAVGAAASGQGRAPAGRAGGPATAIEFLRCRTPAAWLDAAVGELGPVLQDHATLELKAADQAQRLIRRYGAGRGDGFTARLIAKMSRLAREELRHFEHVVDALGARGLGYRPVSASRYAAALHSHVRPDEPARLIDTLLVGAIIEARSCERFASLAPALEPVDAELAKRYRSLLRAEARHYRDYLDLASEAASTYGGGAVGLDARLDFLLREDALLVTSADAKLRFLSGVPARAPQSVLNTAPSR